MDEIAEINGIKPNVLLTDGEEREVGSTTSKSKYKVKRTIDHYHCTCPAWRNQARTPVNARTCKHLKALLGSEYENARILLKNPDGPLPPGSNRPAKSKPTKTSAATSTRTKPASKRKRAAGVDEGDDAEMEAQEEAAPKKVGGRAAKRAKVEKRSEPEVETKFVVEEGIETGVDGGKASQELSEINGIKPLVVLQDGEETEVGSATGKSKYKVKRTFDHYCCSCPAWRNQARVPVNARTCKHLGSLLGDAYEEARLQLKTSSGTSKPDLKEGDVDMTDDNKPGARGASEGGHKEDATTAGEDELAEISGVKPTVYMKDGEEREVGSATSKSKYKIKRTFNHYYCSCPAWRNQAGVPVNARTCKHLKSLFGEAYEKARLGVKNSSTSNEATSGTTSKTKANKPASKANAKPTSSKARPTQTKVEHEEDVDMDNDGERFREQDAEGEQGDSKVTEGLEQDAGLTGVSADGDGDHDELMEVGGVKPKVYMKDGDEREIESFTSNSKYKVKRTWDHYYCSCPAWRNQGGVPVNARTCKHLKQLLGEAYESARILSKNPDGPQPTTTNKKPRAKGGKAKADEGGEGGDEEAESDKVPRLLLAVKWDLDSGPDPTGWWISEKLDGVRTYYDGTRMISRLGNPFTPPQWFLDKLPKDVTLDGELFSGRGEFQSTVSIVKTGNSPHWKNIMFQVFDVPSRGNEPFESRLAFLQSLFGPGGSHSSEHVVVVAHEQARDRQHVLDKLKEIEGVGGEGLMLRKPKSAYEGYRSSTLLKIKTFYDAEAIVTGYVEGKGKNKGVTGALQCEMESGKTFSVGSGLTDKQRKNPPAIGSIVVYRFQELTKDRVPRFPTFVGIAADKDKPKDAEIPEYKIQSDLKGDADA